MRNALAVTLFYAGNAMGAPVTATDDNGDTIRLPSPPIRIVSLAPHATELLFAAGAGDRIVGVLTSSQDRRIADSVSRVGSNNALDLERIIALRPDLIVAWPYVAAGQIDQLRRVGTEKRPIFLSRPDSIAAIADSIEQLGQLAGTGDVARAAASLFRARLKAISERYAGRTPLKIFYEVWHTPLYTLGGKHLVSDALRLCGAENVFGSSTLPAPAITLEAVLGAEPDAIISGTAGAVPPFWLKEWSRWPHMKAVRNHALLTVDADLLHRPGPRFVEGIDQLCNAVERARQARGG